MSNRAMQIDQRWLAEQMTRLVNSPVPTGTIVDCAANSKIAQSYVEEVNRYLNKEEDGRKLRRQRSIEQSG